jgi:nicotinamidase-related amidase
VTTDAQDFDASWLARSALLLVDMNRSHLDHSIGHLLVEEKEAGRIVARAVQVRDAFAAAGRPVIFVRTHHRADGPPCENRFFPYSLLDQ